MKSNIKGQVWVETVIYTLIGLVLIGTVLAFATPFINEQKDRAIIERTFESMNVLDNSILNIKSQGIGNTRKFSFLIGDGTFEVNPKNNELIFQIEGSRHAYSEPGITVNIPGTNIKARTIERNNRYDITMTLNYDGKIDIIYDNDFFNKQIFDAAPNPYLLILENLGRVPVSTICTANTVCSTTTLPDHTCNDAGDKCVPDYTQINIYSVSN